LGKESHKTVEQTNRNIVAMNGLVQMYPRRLGKISAAITLVLLVVLPANATSSPLLTSSLTASVAVQTTFQGATAVKVNYTDTLTGSMLVVIWLAVQNSNGQTVGVFVTTLNFASGGGEKLTAYVVVSGVASGSYTANMFAVTVSGVPVSTTSTVTLSL
jgi:hypothetical protein